MNMQIPGITPDAPPLSDHILTLLQKGGASLDYCKATRLYGVWKADAYVMNIDPSNGDRLAEIRIGAYLSRA